MTREELREYVEELESQGEIPYYVYSNLIDCIDTLEQEPTTKNDLPHCQCTDEEIAKSFIEDVEAVKDQLPCGQMMDFPDTFDEFVKDYGFKDKDEVYTNGSELIPVFRVKQWLEHISTTKNDLGDDCVRRKAVLNTLERMDKVLDEDRTVDSYKELLKECYKVLPSVTPQEPILDRITEIIEPLRHLSIDEMSGIEWQILQVINKYKAESEDK